MGSCYLLLCCPQELCTSEQSVHSDKAVAMHTVSVIVRVNQDNSHCSVGSASQTRTKPVEQPVEHACWIRTLLHIEEWCLLGCYAVWLL
jgi:hypothetical protein